MHLVGLLSQSSWYTGESYLNAVTLHRNSGQELSTLITPTIVNSDRNPTGKVLQDSPNCLHVVFKMK